MSECITGIQQVGIGVKDAVQAKYLYKTLFGMDTLIFEDTATAPLMTAYTGNVLHYRHAILSLNMRGGGGFEIWQYTSRAPLEPMHPLQLGDLGIFAVKIKSSNIIDDHAFFRASHKVVTSQILTAPDGRKHFWLTDIYENRFNIVEGYDWFKWNTKNCGGVTGAVIGVSDMDKSLVFYKDMLGINKLVYDLIAPMQDGPPGQQGKLFRRVLLKKDLSGKGAFCKLLGSVQIELYQVLEGRPDRIFANRFWGDCGFIHLCFDVMHMDRLQQTATNAGYAFSVDSAGSFSMGESAGRFCYLEDPDGTLIELVETHKIPILKKVGWYLNLQKRKHHKPLPNWMISLLALNKVR